MTVTGLDHVQLAMPAEREEEADAFYRDLLGFTVIPKPPPLAARLQAAGGMPRWEDDQPGMRHCYLDDPFGNRIELVAS
jgi:catechol 2,3-dioxygenase-like lactoylglutathione lyase family enzyme